MYGKSIGIGIGILLLIGVAFFLLYDRDTKIVNYPSYGTEIIAFGDSLVEGAGATDERHFVGLLEERIGLPIRNEGVAGDTTRDALARLERAVGEDPRVVLVLLGGNDYIQRVPREETFQNLAIITRYIQDRGGVVLILGVRGGIISDSYEEDYRDFAREHGAAYVSNVLDGLLGNPALMADAIHPNNEGYAIIADRVEPVLRTLLDLGISE